MTVNLPGVIKAYVDASNKHDVQSILACFSDDALVQDEGETFQGKKAIEAWIVKTIEKYKFQFKPTSITSGDTGIVVATEVTGTFDGSPITIDYHFTIRNGKILSLAVD